jgi:hypothetical protein
MEAIDGQSVRRALHRVAPAQQEKGMIKAKGVYSSLLIV